jgi:hypothetical protein
MTLNQVRELALALPGVFEAPHFHRTSFRVAGKMIATALPEDEEYLNVFVNDHEREAALIAEPDFLEDLYWGKNIVGLRVRLGGIKSEVVEQLLQQVWRRKAPKKLLAASLPRSGR